MMRSWTVEAVNLPEHADNPIHTDAGARAAGFPGALVAGITVYAYLTHVPASASGAAWVGGGRGEVRFLSPIFDGDTVACELADVDLVEARVAGDVRAVVDVVVSVAGRPVATLEHEAYVSLTG